jgi:hypothetical protein
VRRSADEALESRALRGSTVGSGFNELEELTEELDAIIPQDEEPEGTPPPAISMSSTARKPSPKPVSPRHTLANENQQSDHGQASSAILVVILGIFIKLVLQPPSSPLFGVGIVPHWVVILGCLVVLAVLLIGAGNVVQIFNEWRSHPPLGLRVPLTDTELSMRTINKFANSAQVREKGLKILQYVLRGSSYSALFSAATSSHLKGLSKTISVARRFFKFCRWVKHFEDVDEATTQKNPTMRALLVLRIGANSGADWAEDVCSLERMGILPKDTLSAEFLLLAEYCQLVLALVEVVVTAVKVRKEKAVVGLARAAGAAGPNMQVQRRALALVRLELLKFVSDIGKALYDCELRFAHEGIFIGCALFSALLSTHKNMVKVLKTVK